MGIQGLALRTGDFGGEVNRFAQRQQGQQAGENFFGALLWQVDMAARFNHDHEFAALTVAVLLKPGPGFAER